jgi:predicted deacylase
MAAAIDADIVLDLHCDTEAVLHLYTGTPLIDRGLPLARLLGAKAMLTAEISGDDPFDEACSRPWWELARHFHQHPMPAGCFSATVELRGATDVEHRTAKEDAAALIAFMVLNSAIVGERPALPVLSCQVTPLGGSEPVFATTSGVVVFHRNVGDRVLKGDAIADLVDPVSGDLVTLVAPTSGTLYARTASRWAYAGMRLAKVAGTEATRSGHLLSP